MRPDSAEAAWIIFGYSGRRGQDVPTLQGTFIDRKAHGTHLIRTVEITLPGYPVKPMAKQTTDRRLDYWNEVIPDTAIFDAIRDRLELARGVPVAHSERSKPLWLWTKRRIPRGQIGFSGSIKLASTMP
jgi:hypothetical protein